jgi:hypothetical protein
LKSCHIARVKDGFVKKILKVLYFKSPKRKNEVNLQKLTYRSSELNFLFTYSQNIYLVTC